MAKKRKSLKVYVILIIPLAIAAVSFFLLRSSDTDESDSLDRSYIVTRGDFNITILQNGTLDSIKRHDLRCETSGHVELKIEWIVEDKTPVKQDDVLVRFSQEQFVQEEEKLLLQIEDEQSNLVLAQQDLEMRRSTNLSNIKSAATDLRNARDTLEKYTDLDAPEERKSLLAKISEAENNLESARKDAAKAREEMQAATWEEESKRDELTAVYEEKENLVETSENLLDNANHNLQVFKQYTFPQKMRTLKEDVSKKELNLQKVVTDCQSNIITIKQRIHRSEMGIKQHESQLERIQEDMEKLVIKAPVDGIVNLGNPNRRHWNEPKEYKVGAVIHRGEIFAYIPDLSKFVVKTDIPEEHRFRVKVGLPAKMHAGAIEDLVMDGEISEIAPMANNVVRWDKNSPKIYAAEISTDMVDPRLTPGMTVDIEIIAKTVEDVIFVPVEAVYNREGETYCRKKSVVSYKEHPVKVGDSSIDFVEIKEGLEEGDVVLLSRMGEKAGSE